MYKAAIDQMVRIPQQKNGQFDPMSWEGQAQIHNNSCPHGNGFFLPWHRQYLADFESVINYWAKQSADPKVKAIVASGHEFALPYWDWTHKGTDQFALPTFITNDSDFDHGKFRIKNKEIESMRYEGREAKPGFAAEFMGTAAVANVMAAADFASFGGGGFTGQMDQGTYGELEGTPHNNVHVAVGGEMGAMLSPRDPIFWMHHCNVDRLWAEWSLTRSDAKRKPAGADGNAWLNYTLDGYFNMNADGSFNQTGKTVQVKNLLTPEAVGFTYNTIQGRTGVALALADSGAAEPTCKTDVAKAVTFTQRPDPRMSNMMFFKVQPQGEYNNLRDFVTSGFQVTDRVIKLRISNLPIPDGKSTVRRLLIGFANDKTSGFFQVMINYAFFGMSDLQHRMHHQGMNSVSIEYDITDRVRKVAAKQSFDFGDFKTFMISTHDRTVDGVAKKATDSDTKAYLDRVKSGDLGVAIIVE